MRKQCLFIIIALAVLTTMSVYPLEAQDFEILGNTRSSLELSLNINDLSLENHNYDGLEGQNIILSGIFLPNKAGMPDLPVVSRYVAIPRGAEVSLSVKNQVTETIHNVELMPAPALPLDDDDSPMKYVRDEEVYSTDAFYPAEPFITSKPTKIRDVDVVIVSVTPFQYNPVTKDLIVTRKLDFEVVFDGGDGTFGGDPRYRSDAWDHIIRDMVINESILPDADYQNFLREAIERGDTGCEYLIITPDNPDFIRLADSIKLFRNQQGILTDVMTVSECGGNTQNAIKNTISQAYNTWDIPVSAVLLLGDHNTDGTQGIVSYSLNNHPGGTGYNPYISDNKYADVNGDHLPDVVMGRITGRNYEEMYLMINKDLEYERHPTTNPRFYDKPITAMGFQLERWFQLCSEIVNGFWEHSLGKHPVRVNAIYEGTPGSSWSSAQNTNTIVNYFGPNGRSYIPQTMSHLTEWNGNALDINTAINAGAFILQHRDHGAEELWGEPRYNIGSIHALVNPDLTYVMSNNCLTGKFNYNGTNGECFAEAFHRHQYGALGLVAATQVSYSFVNDVYVWGVYDNMWPYFMPTYGTQHPKDFILPAYSNASGKYFLHQSSWTDDGVKEITYYLFHHHGDTYMNLYTEMPQELEVTMIPVIVEGATQYRITATHNATICITNGNTIIGLATASGYPQNITITPQSLGDELVLTITKQNYFRYTRKIKVIPNQGPYLILSEIGLNDQNGDNKLDFNESATLNVSLHNVGFESIQNIDVTLTSDSPYVTITSGATNYSTISSDEIVNKNDAFSIQVSDDVPDQTAIAFTLTMQSGERIFTDHFNIVANAPVFKVTDVHFTDANGNPTDRLYKGETSSILYNIKNQGHSNSNEVNCDIIINSPFIEYENTSYVINGIGTNDSIDAVFVVTVSDESPDGAIFKDYLTMSSDGYDVEFESEIPLGNCTENFESEELNPLFDWVNTGNYPWVLDNTNPYEGNYCYTSTSDKATRTSKLMLGVTTEIDDVISFYYKGSLNGSDAFTFSFGSEKYNLVGSQWQYFECPVPAGYHIFKWIFSRKSNANMGSGSIDLIKLPPMHYEITGIEEVTGDDDIVRIYPNPGNNELNIMVSDDSCQTLQIYDFQGRIILEKFINNKINTINTANWATGMYLWKVGNKTGKWIKSR